jgi:hypothetical protein
LIRANRMNEQSHIVAALALLSVFAATLHAEQILTNADIVKLANSGMSEQLILSVIANETSHFDLAPEALIELRRQGVSDKVIREMLKSVAAGRGAGSASAMAGSSPAAGAAPFPGARITVFPIAFSAEQVSFEEGGGEARVAGKLYVGLDRLRFEQAEGSEAKVTIVDLRARSGYVQTPGKPRRLVMGFMGVSGPGFSDGLSPYFLPMNPSNPCLRFAEVIRCRALGREVTGGRDTVKWEFTYAYAHASWTVYHWIDPKLDVAVKRQSQNHITELRHIVEQSPPAHLFEFPDGVQK